MTSTRSREVTSRYKLSPSPTHPLSKRFPSPLTVHGSLSLIDSSSSPSKRSLSAERLRGRNPPPPPPPSPRKTDESKVSKNPSHEAAILHGPRRFSAPTKVPWPSTRPFSGTLSCDFSDSLVSEASQPICKLKSPSSVKAQSRKACDQALKPSANVVPKTCDSRKVVSERKPVSRLSQNRDHSENAMPQDNVRLLDHHGILGSRSSIKKSSSSSNSSSIMRLSGAGALARSVDLASIGDKPLNSRLPSSTSLESKTSSHRESLPRSLSSSRAWKPNSLNEGPTNMTKVRSESRNKTSIDEVTITSIKSKTDSRGRTQDHLRKVSNGSSRDSLHHVKVSTKDPLPHFKGLLRSVSSNLSEHVDLQSERHGRQTTDLSCYETRTSNGNTSDTESGSLSGTRMKSTSSSGSGALGNTAGMRVREPTVSACYFQGTREGRVLPRLKTIGRPQRSSSSLLNSPMSSPWSVMSNRSFSGFPQQPHTPARVSSHRHIPSPSKLRTAPQTMQIVSRARNASLMLRFGADMRKGKKGLGQVDETHLHRILHNRLIQWRLVNARAKASMKAQNFMAEKSLYNVYMKIFDLRSSVAKKKAKLHQARRARRLSSLLSAQSPMLEDWVSIQNEHTIALKGIMEALEAAVLRVPVSGGVKADTLAIKSAMTSAFDVLNRIEKSANYLLPKVEKTNSLISELGLVATQEKVLLEECVSLLATISALEIEERSIQAYFVQCEHEKIRVLGHLMDTATSTL